MAAAGKFFITPHAVERFRERGRRGPITYEEALARMIEIAARAHYVGPGNDGKERWRTGKPGRWRLTVAPAVGNELPQVLTIMAEHDGIAPKREATC